MPPKQLVPRLEAALKLAERRAREQFYDKEDAWAAVSHELYRSSMEEIQTDETFSRLLYLKHCVDSLVIQHPKIRFFSFYSANAIPEFSFSRVHHFLYHCVCLYEDITCMFIFQQNSMANRSE